MAVPAAGEYTIPEPLGDPDRIMIGRILWQEFFNNHDWPVASAIAVMILLLLMLPSNMTSETLKYLHKK